jgi:hypothetical protein
MECGLTRCESSSLIPPRWHLQHTTQSAQNANSSTQNHIIARRPHLRSLPPRKHQLSFVHISRIVLSLPTDQGHTQEGWGRGATAHPPKPPKLKLKKNTDFVAIMISKVLRDLPFSRNQPLKSPDDKYITILKNKLIKLKKQEDRTLWLSHGTCSYIRVYMNAVADSVMLCLQHDFYNIIFKIKHKFYTAQVSAPFPQWQIQGARLQHAILLSHVTTKTVTRWTLTRLLLLHVWQIKNDDKLLRAGPRKDVSSHEHRRLSATLPGQRLRALTPCCAR